MPARQLEDSRSAALFAIHRFLIQKIEITPEALAYVLQKAGYDLTPLQAQAKLADMSREALGDFDGETFTPIDGLEQEIEDRGWKDLPAEKRKEITMSQLDLLKSGGVDAALDRWRDQEMNRFLGANPESTMTNAVCLKIVLPEKGMIIRIDMSPALASKYEPTVDSARRKVLEDLEKELALPVVHIRTGGNAVFAYIGGRIRGLPHPRFYSVGLNATEIEDGTVALDDNVYRSIAEWVLRVQFEALGYHQARGKREYYQIENPETMAWGRRTLSRYPGFETEVENTVVNTPTETEVTVWVDAVSRDGIRVKDAVRQDEGSSLIGADAILLPGGWSATIEGRGPENVDLAKYQGPDDKLTLAEKFDRFYGTRPSRGKDNIWLVRRDFGTKRLEAWPESYVLLSTRDKTVIHEDQNQYPSAAMDPVIRLGEVATLVHDISSRLSSTPLPIQGKIDGPLSLGALGVRPSAMGRAYRPSFRFKGNQLGNSTLGIFRFGPISQPKRVRVVGVLQPEGIVLPMEAAFHELAAEFSRRQFGQIIIDNPPILLYAPTSDLPKLVELASARSAHEPNETPILLGVLEGGSSEMRVKLKEASHIAASAACQCVSAETIKAIGSRAEGVARGLALQMYLKCIAEGEAMWVVDPPVDTTGTTAFVAVGYSADPNDPENRANSFAALSDPSGGHVHWQGVGAVGSREKYMTRDAVKSLQRFVLRAIADRPFKRIVLYRRGDFYSEERAAILEGFGDDFRKRYALDFVSVKDTSARLAIQRKATGEVHPNLVNAPPGFYVVLDENRALLSTSYLEEQRNAQGTTQLVMLTRETGSTPIQQIVQEYRAQTFLCWESPANPGKSPLVLHLCDEIASLMRFARDPDLCKHFPG